MGRRAHQPTDRSRAEVAALCSFGVPIKMIASYIGIDDKTLSKYYRNELDTAKAKAHAKVAKFLYRAATGDALQDENSGASYADCIRAAIFWAKTQMGFRETTNLDHTTDGQPITSPSDVDCKVAAAVAKKLTE